MIHKLIGGVRRAFGLQHPGRNLEVWPDDVFLVSFPKSGNTWTRFLVANLVHPDVNVDFSNIDTLTPTGQLTKRELDRLPRPRIFKSHEYFHPRYKHVIYIVRDPRDVAVSQFHFDRKRRRVGDDYPLEKFVERFIAGESSDPGACYGSWCENVASWVATRENQPGFLLLRYEDMLEDTARELAKIAAFLDIPPDPVRIQNAVARSAASEMRKLEKSQHRQWGLTKNTRQDVLFVRAAESGGWRNELSDEAVAQLEAAWGRWMVYLGYELRFSKYAMAPDARMIETVFGGPNR